jgi:integrase/recombinase XerD
MMKGFYKLLEDYVLIHLPKECGYPKTTVTSYYTSIEQFVSWLEEQHEIHMKTMTIHHFTRNHVQEFLHYLEENKQCKISTRNQRQAGINSFLAYVADVEPLYMNTFMEVKKIKVKKAEKPEKVFLTVEEYKAIINAIDPTTDTGIKHYTLINMMYDTAARVQESIDMKIEDFLFGKENSVHICGKGSKHRRVYITKHSVKLIKCYIERFHMTEGVLFRNRSGVKLSDSGIDFILKKYVSMAVLSQPSLSGKRVSPHTLRRSKATHMLLNGASLPVIQRFLGHESIQTTEAYLDVGTESMIKAVDDASKLIFDEEAVNAKPVWKDEDVMKRLKSLLR